MSFWVKYCTRKTGLRVLLKWKIYRPDSVVTVVIRLANIGLGIYQVTNFLGDPEFQQTNLKTDGTMFVAAIPNRREKASNFLSKFTH